MIENLRKLLIHEPYYHQDIITIDMRVVSKVFRLMNNMRAHDTLEFSDLLIQYLEEESQGQALRVKRTAFSFRDYYGELVHDVQYKPSHPEQSS